MKGPRSHKIGLIFAVLSLAGPLVLASGQATAAEASDSDALITRGLALRQAGKDREALPLFQEAATQKRTPRAIAQVGLCEFALGLWVEAEDHVQQALASRTDPWIRKNEARLKESLGEIQGKLGFLDVWGEPAGARVAVDGHPMGTLPLERPLRLPTGRHSLLIEAAGFLTASRFVEVPARNVTREHAALAVVPVLTPVPASTPVPVPTPLPPPTRRPATVVGERGGSGGAPEREPASSSSDPIYTRWWFWTAIGVVAAAAGGTALVLSHRKENCDAAGGGACAPW